MSVERVVMLAWAGVLVGGVVLAASMRTLYRALRFRFRRGMPYIEGSIVRAVNAAALGAVLFSVGAALGGARWTLEGFEPVSGMVEVARIRVTDPGGGLLLEMTVGDQDPDNPERHGAVGLDGDRWTVAGTVVSFPPWLEPFGLDTRHRLAGGREPGRSGPDSAADRVTYLESLPEWLGVRVRRYTLDGRGPLPDWTGVALEPSEGYFLAFPGEAPVAVGEPR